MSGALILINGFPGVGKHSVALEVVKLLPNCKFFDTRNLIAAASQLFDSDDPAHGHLRKNLKHAIFDSIARQYANLSPTGPPPPIYVLTDFLSVSARPTDRAIMHEFIAFASKANFSFIHVILSCTTDTNVSRLTHPDRLTSGALVTNPAHLLQTRMEEEVGHIGTVQGLCGEYELNTTAMDVATTAAVVAEYSLDTLRGQGWWIQLCAGERRGPAREAKPTAAVEMKHKVEKTEVYAPPQVAVGAGRLVKMSTFGLGKRK